MTAVSRHFAIFGALLFGLGLAWTTPAAAQATRTWVSGVGDDVNPCSRTAPCKTFAGAISKTAAGGEINCLDPGGFGAVTITKSLTISCPYTEGGALAGGNGITVNLPLATDVVFIRGLDIFGVNPPSNGVRMIGNGTLHIEDCTIRRFNAVNSHGVSFQPSGAARLFISNTTIAENGNGATGGGILIQPTGAGGSARVVMRNVRMRNNANNNLLVNLTGNTAVPGVAILIDDSEMSGSNRGLHALVPPATSATTIMVTNSIVAFNTTNGILADGTNSTVQVANTTITGNGTGVLAQNGGGIFSYVNNRVDGNVNANGTFTLPNLVPR